MLLLPTQTLALYTLAPSPSPSPINLTLTLTLILILTLTRYVTLMRQCGLWLYETHEKRLYEAHDGLATSREAFKRMGSLDRS